MFKTIFLIAFVYFSFFSASAQTTLLNFNNLNNGNLNGQDGWVTRQHPLGGEQGDIQVVSNEGFDGTKALYHNFFGAGVGVTASKQIPAGMFSDLSADYIISFEMVRTSWTMNVGIGFDANNDGEISNEDGNEKCIVFNNDNIANNLSNVTLPSGIESPGISPGQLNYWHRVEIRLSQLNIGSGKITVTDYDLSDNSSRIIVDNADLGISTANDKSNPANWNMYYINIQTEIGRVDNFKIEKISSANRSLQFDGINDNILLQPNSLLDFSGASNFSVSGWVYPTAGNAVVYSKWKESAYNLQVAFGVSNSRVRLCMDCFNCGGWNGFESVNIIPNNRWSYITFTKNGSTASMYINGVFDNSLTLTVPLNAVASTGRTVIGGDGLTINPAYANQNLDEVSIWG
jgi:hypothetical protein